MTEVRKCAQSTVSRVISEYTLFLLENVEKEKRGKYRDNKQDINTYKYEVPISVILMSRIQYVMKIGATYFLLSYTHSNHV